MSSMCSAGGVLRGRPSAPVFFALEVRGDVGDVVAVVGACLAGHCGSPGLKPRARSWVLRGQRLDLHAGVVVVELAPTLARLAWRSRLQMASPSAAWRPWPTCSGPVGLAETNSTSTLLAGCAGSRPKCSPADEHLAHHLLLGGGLEADVEEAGPGDLDGIDPLVESGGRLQRGARCARPARAACARAAWRLHGGRAGEVAMGRHLGRLGTTALAPAPGERDSSVSASAASSSCLTNSIAGFYRGKPSPRAATVIRWSGLPVSMVSPAGAAFTTLP